MPEFGDVEFIKQQRKNREAHRRLTAFSGKKYIRAKFTAEGEVVLVGKVTGECIGILEEDFEEKDYEDFDALLNDFSFRFEQKNDSVLFDEVLDSFVDQARPDFTGVESLYFEVLSVDNTFKGLCPANDTQLKLFDYDNKKNK